MLSLILCHYKFVFNHWDYFKSNFWHLLQLVQAFVLILIFSAAALISNHCLIFTLITNTVELLIWKMRMWQVNYSITSYYRGRNQRLTLSKLTVNYKRLLLYIFSIKPIGKIFVAFLITYVPISGWSVIEVLNEQFNPFYHLTLIFTCSYQLACIFVGHYMIAKRNMRLSDVSKRFTSIPLQRKLTRTVRLRISLFLQAVFNKQRYGITYWKFGLISHITYAEVRRSFILIKL